MILNKYANIFLSVALLTVVATVIFYSLGNYHNYCESNRRLAERSVISTSREIKIFIDERNRTVSLFADQEKRLLSSLIQDPYNQKAHQALEEKINAYFPGRFAFTVADAQGHPLLIQGKGLIGKACRKDIRTFSGYGHQNRIYVHQSPKISRQHYDVMTAIQNGTETSHVLFVSFFLDDIFRIIEHGEIEGHHLFLVKRGKPSVIEASTQGALALFEKYGHEFKLVPSVKPGEYRTVWPGSLDQFVTVSQTVDGTHWELLDVPDTGAVQRYKNRLVMQASGILSLFALVTLAGFWLARRIGTLSGDTRTVLDSVEKERKRVAMDLHDQVLSDISHMRRGCQNMTGRRGAVDSVENPLVSLDSELEKIANSIRQIIDDLHPQSIELLGFGETLRSYCRNYSEQQQAMEVSLIIGDWNETQLNRTEKLNLYQIFQEVLQNASKHARATQCDINLTMTSQKLVLSIKDNGAGLSTAETRSCKGRGMKNIRARSRIIQAKPDWSSTPEGTCFTLEMPLGD